MKSAQLATLRFLSLAFLLPGIGGLVLSTMISGHYLDTMPRWPDPDSGRIVVRGIHGIPVYQTEEEDRRLSLIEYSSVGFFTTGLVMGLVFLQKQCAAPSREEEDEAELAKSRG
jgi:hypothetical protein